MFVKGPILSDQNYILFPIVRQITVRSASQSMSDILNKLRFLQTSFLRVRILQSENRAWVDPGQAGSESQILMAVHQTSGADFNKLSNWCNYGNYSGTAKESDSPEYLVHN